LLLGICGLALLAVGTQSAFAISAGQPAAGSLQPHETPAATDTPTAAATNTPQPTKAATATTTSHSSNQNTGGTTAPQPTSVSFAQPTVGSSSDSNTQAVAPASLGSSGLMIATIMSCVSGVLGVIIFATALTILLRGGYGPFLRALLRNPGKRRGSARGRGGYSRGRLGESDDESMAYGSYGSNGRGGGGRNGTYGDPRRAGPRGGGPGSRSSHR
jgi:hypothetical protein